VLLDFEADEYPRAGQGGADQNTGPIEARRVLGGGQMTIVKINGRELLLKECPECHREVISLIREFRDDDVIRTFCYHCDEDAKSTAATITRKLHEHAIAGTLDQYPLAERIADLNGEKYVKPN